MTIDIDRILELSSDKHTRQEVVRLIASESERWRELLQSFGTSKKGDSDRELLVGVVTLFGGKVCASDAFHDDHDTRDLDSETPSDEEVEGRKEFQVNFHKILGLLVSTQRFFSVVADRISQWNVEILASKKSAMFAKEKGKLVEFLSSSCHLCRILMETMPLTAKDVLSQLIVVALGSLAISDLGKEHPQVVEDFKKIQSSILQYNKQLESKQEREAASRRNKYGFTEDEELRMHDMEPPNDFRSIETIPSIHELLTDKRPFLKPNKPKGNYDDAHHYQDVQYRLLREDFVQPLRKGLEDFLQHREEYIQSKGKRRKTGNQQNINVRVYVGLWFKDKEKTKENASNYLFQLPGDLCKKIKWEKSKRLLPGSLVLLSTDCFKSAIFATLLAPPRLPLESKRKENNMDPRRQELAQGILRAAIETGEETLDVEKPYVMLECEAFFEAFRHNLKILQTMELELFPLKRFIVEPESSIVRYPSYFEPFVEAVEEMNEDPDGADNAEVADDAVLQRRPDVKIKLPFSVPQSEIVPKLFGRMQLRVGIGRKVRIGCMVSVTDPESWPKHDIQKKLGLDDDQYGAYRAALTSDLSVIQGPPGTGKTYIGLHIVKTLLENKRRNCLSRLEKNQGHTPDAPILVVCYTNHALDQFLELLIAVHGISIVRVGGQCKSDVLKDCMLGEKRKRLRSFKTATNSTERKIIHVMGRQQKREKTAWIETKRLEEKIAYLRNLLTELSSVSGIINFKNLEIFDRLTRLIPEALFAAMTFPEWFGLNDDLFLSPYFKVSELMPRWFKLRSAYSDRTAEPHTDAASVLRNPNGTGMKNLSIPIENTKPELDTAEDMEDYDMNELLEHRVEDACYDYDELDYEYSGQTNNQFVFVHKCSLQQSWHKIHFLNGEMQKLVVPPAPVSKSKKGKKKNKKTRQEDAEYIKFQQQMAELQNMKNTEENRWKLFTAIFDMHRRKLLNLPDVSQWLNELKQRNLQPQSATPTVEEYTEDSDLEEDDGIIKDDRGWLSSGGSFRQKEWMLTTAALGNLKVDFKWALYFHAIDTSIAVVTETIPKLKECLKKAYHDLNLERQRVDGLILRHSDIIGMTTTGAAKNHFLLEEIAKPEIVIIEEAAEILEAHAITSLTKDCKQLILIGDHLQLRPNTNVYHLGEKFHMNVSLFERMMNNQINGWSLKTQHRMRPEIADLVVGPIYSELHNHESVLTYPDVKGLTKNLFFLSHTESENTDADSLSKSNYHEADFMAGFCDYLLKQLYEPTQITVLTTYIGQMFLLKNRMASAGIRGVRVTCVDNFQGEENDIILLSLVRSNEEDKIGFVGIDNRICVALSRARHGLYIMGNVKNLISRSETWQKIHKKLEAGNNIGERLTLTCKRHETLTEVKTREDFEHLVNGGCTLVCGIQLPCSHSCHQICHVQDENHLEYRCREKCLKLCKQGEHECKGRCSDKCPACLVQVTKKLSCGHDERLPCYKDIMQVECSVIVPRILPKCRHEEDLPCHFDPAKFVCKRKVSKVLNCGLDHTKEVECHVDVDKITCKEMVTKTLIPCGHEQFVQCWESPEIARCTEEVDVIFKDCNHARKMQCWQTKTEKCTVKCEVDLECGHQCTLDCHVTEDPNHETYRCKKRCLRSCTEGHKCSTPHSCCNPCPPCATEVARSLPCDPNHLKFLPCHDDGTGYKCTQKVMKVLPCDPTHTEEVPCHYDVSKYKCQRKVEKVLPCGHSKSVSCFLDPSKVVCKSEGLRRLACGHSVKQKCNVSLDTFICRELKLKTCSNCNFQRYVICCFNEILGCLQEPCRKRRRLSSSVDNDNFENAGMDLLSNIV